MTKVAYRSFDPAQFERFSQQIRENRGEISRQQAGEVAKHFKVPLDSVLKLREELLAASTASTDHVGGQTREQRAMAAGGRQPAGMVRVQGVGVNPFMFATSAGPRSGGRASLTMGEGGILKLSNDLPLKNYRTEQGVIERFRKAALPGKQAYMQAIRNQEAPPYSDFGALYEAKQLMKERPELSQLLPEEVAAIRSYCDFDYQSLSDALWQSRLPEPSEQDKCLLLLSGTNRLPDCAGKVLRADFFTASMDEIQQNVGNRIALYRELMNTSAPFVPKSFLSCTAATSEGAREMVAEHATIILEIESRTGKNISRVSSRPEEQEVLFRPGTPFKVIAIDEKKVKKSARNPLGKAYRVRLQEIAE